MRHVTCIRIGPRTFRIGSDWRAPIAALESLYAAYPTAAGIAHFTVRLEARRWWRRIVRPQVTIGGDHTLPDALPVSLDHALLAAEMAMNLQMALGERRFLLLHASSVERDGQVLLMTGDSGSGKSTLAALLATRGWRLMGDEFALIDPLTGLAHPFPRPVSLKNSAIGVMQSCLPDDRFGPLIRDTPKGDIRHLIPDVRAIAGVETPGRPALILFPRFGAPADTRPVGAAEGLVRLTQASTNYPMLGEAGFNALVRLVSDVPCRAIDYPDSEAALKRVEALL
jgi:HprK-related kinase A